MATAQGSTQELTTFSRADWQDNSEQQERQQDFQSLLTADSIKDTYFSLQHVSVLKL